MALEPIILTKEMIDTVIDEANTKGYRNLTEGDTTLIFLNDIYYAKLTIGEIAIVNVGHGEVPAHEILNGFSDVIANLMRAIQPTIDTLTESFAKIAQSYQNVLLTFWQNTPDEIKVSVAKEQSDD